MTLLGRFTLLGRLRKQWADAVADPEPTSAMQRLREVRARFPEGPEAAELWPAFLQDCFADRFRPYLSYQDFVDLRDTGARLAAASQGTLPLDGAWQPLIARADPAVAPSMLTELYRSPLTSPQGRVAAAVELARRGARDDVHLAVYAELPALVGPLPPPVAALVDQVLFVDLNTDTESLTRAGTLARLQLEAGYPVAGTVRAYGLHLLREGTDLPAAARHLAEAVRLSPADPVALTALLSVWTMQGDAASVMAADRPGRPTSPVIEDLFLLARVLTWLDSPSAAPVSGLPPSTAAGLAALPLRPYAGMWLDYAVGRLHLVEGDARTAASLLVPISERHPRLRWAYHAAWALLLSGDRGPGLAALFRRVPPGPVAWTVACVLLDGHPGSERGADMQDVLDVASPAYVPVVEARMALVDASGTPGEPMWPQGSGTIEEDLESLRTVMGVRFASREASGLAQALALPLFQRLPLAEQALWRALAVLLTDQERGRGLLEETALRFGHPRAALVLSAHDLHAGRTDTVDLLVERFPNGGSRKAQLLRAWADARRGREGEAAERLRSQGRLSAGLLGVLQVLAGDLEGAGETLRDAASAADLALAVRLATTGDPGLMTRHLDPGQDPWRAWLFGLARLAEAPEDADLGTCGRLVDLATTPVAATALAGALAAACLRSDDQGKAEVLTSLLGRLSAASGLPEVAGAHRLAVAATTRRRWSADDAGRPPHLETGIAPNNAPLALVTARLALAHDDREAAVRLLRATDPGPDTVHALCDLVSDVLDPSTPQTSTPQTSTPQTSNRETSVRQTSSPQTSDRETSDRETSASQISDPRTSGDREPAAVRPEKRSAVLPDDALAALSTDARHAADLLRAARDGASRLVLDVARARDVTGLVDLGRVLPTLVAETKTSRNGDHPLAGFVAELAASGSGALDALTLVRCAMAVGDFALADRLWPRAADASQAGREEYARYLRHRAWQARRDGEVETAVGFLRQARDGLAETLELEMCARALLAWLPRRCGEEPGPTASERPGRHRTIERFIADHPSLRAALLSADDEAIDRAWAACDDDARRDLDLQHALAVAALDCAPETFNVGLWLTLLGSDAFWERLPHVAEHAGKLRERLGGDLLAKVVAVGSQAMTNEDIEECNECLCALHIAADMPERLHDLADETPYPCPPYADGPGLRELAALARTALDRWCSDVLDAANRRAEDPDAIARLPEGIDKDYEAGVERLSPLAEAAAEMHTVGPALARVARTGLGWCNDWCARLYNRRDLDLLEDVVLEAVTFADVLAKVTEKGQGHRPENQLLSRHAMYRGFATDDDDQAERDYREALEWNPTNTNALELLAGAYLGRARKLADRGRYVAARDECEKARALKPIDPDTDRLVDGLWESMAELAPEEANIARLDRAEQAINDDDFDRALDELRQIPASSRCSGRATSYQVRAYFRRGVSTVNAIPTDAADHAVGFTASTDTPFAPAVDDLRAAIRLTTDAEDRALFTQQLAMVLNFQAVYLINGARKHLASDYAGRKHALSRARTLLTEAVGLDPSYEAARSNLSAIR